MGENDTVKRMGVLGGTFDPPHYGHLFLADTARVQLRLDRVLFAPAGVPPHKRVVRSPDQSKDHPSAVDHRLTMLRLALQDAGEPAFYLSRVDVDRPGPHYTVDALTILQEKFSAAQIWFLTGADSLVDLPHWRAPARIIKLARLAVLPRPGAEPDMDVLSEAVPRLRKRLDWLAGPPVALSSSALRERVRQGLPLRYLVPPSVEAYVQAHDLYCAPQARADCTMEA